MKILEKIVESKEEAVVMMRLIAFISILVLRITLIPSTSRFVEAICNEP
jgi:hypothetical protein